MSVMAGWAPCARRWRTRWPARSLAAAWLLAAAPHCAAWGPLGHSLPAELAGRYLRPEARAMLERLLPGERLPDIATWADRMRGDAHPFWRKTAHRFHYVTVPDGERYDIRRAPAEGDAVTALRHFRAVLADPAAELAAKQLALRFSVHIVGDLHQPLHVGNGRDRGGNEVAVRWRGKRGNLHRLWDSELIRNRGLSREQWLRHLASGIGQRQARAWDDPRPETWIAESQAHRRQVYRLARGIDSKYVASAERIIDLRLRQSAVRLAAYLNELARQPHDGRRTQATPR